MSKRLMRQPRSSYWGAWKRRTPSWVDHSLSLSKRTIERLDCCKLIVRCGVGYDNVGWVFAARWGIPVANVPDYGTEEVADSAIGLTLALVRGISTLNSWLRDTPEPWTYARLSRCDACGEKFSA